jgi:hypothetical protein
MTKYTKGNYYPWIKYKKKYYQLVRMKENWAECTSLDYLTTLLITEIMYTTEQAWNTGGMILKTQRKRVPKPLFPQ